MNVIETEKQPSPVNIDTLIEWQGEVESHFNILIGTIRKNKRKGQGREKKTTDMDIPLIRQVMLFLACDSGNDIGCVKFAKAFNVSHCQILDSKKRALGLNRCKDSIFVTYLNDIKENASRTFNCFKNN
jgi:hypothetical protein